MQTAKSGHRFMIQGIINISVQQNVTYFIFTTNIYYYITTEFDYVKRDSGLGVAVLQWFEFAVKPVLSGQPQDPC